MDNSVDLSELERYLQIYQENPDSRVFAPLANLYRRIGKLDDAEEICRNGIRRHPYYAGGRVALAHVLYEKNKHEDALKEIEAVVTYYPDNLLARKILIKILMAMDHTQLAKKEWEALQAMAPEIAADKEMALLVNSPSSRFIQRDSLLKKKEKRSLLRQKLIFEELIHSLD